MIGTVRGLQPDKKYGFIKTPDGKGDYFFHKDDFTGEWDTLVALYYRGGEVKVIFETAESSKGLRAANVSMS